MREPNGARSWVATRTSFSSGRARFYQFADDVAGAAGARQRL